jgi:hypothetical protein
MIPNEIQLNKKDVPPMLTNGSVKPVTGTRCRETAILANAWIIILRHSPMASIAPNAFGLRVTILVHLKKSNKYKKMIVKPPRSPYSSHIIE